MKRSQRRRLCPVCGERITINGFTTDGRAIGSCGDAFWTNAELRHRFVQQQRARVARDFRLRRPVKESA